MKLKNMIFYEADGAGSGGAPATPPGDPGGGGTLTPPPAEPAPQVTQPDGGAPANPQRRSVFDEPVVPKEYAFNLGEGLSISDEQKTALTKIAKDNNLPQEAVDALLKMHSDILLGVMHEAEDRYNGWADEAAKQGLTSKENMAFAKKTIEVFGGSAALDALVETGAANNPAVLKMLQNIGSLLSEDPGVGGGGTPAPKAVSDADLLFPNSVYPK